MVRFTLRQTKEILTSQSGLALVGALLQRTPLAQSLNRLPSPQERRFTLKNSDIAFSMVGLLVQGKSDFEAIESFRRDRLFQLALNLSRVPSAAILRQRVDKATEDWDEAIRRANVHLLKQHAVLTACEEGYIPIDMDVSPMDNSGTKKEGVSPTYKKTEGYAPLFVYIGREGYLLNLDFREGRRHSQCEGTVEFLKETLEMLTEFRHREYLLRADSAHDSLDNFVMIEQFNRAHPHIHVDFLIKHNLRRESISHWFEIAKEHGQKTTPREGKTVYTGRILKQYPELEYPVWAVFQITERTVTAQGQHLLIPEIEVDVYLTSLNKAPKKVIELYHDHGTSEQYHSEFKTDIGVERLPSGYFETNQRVMFLTLLAFNLLRIIGQESLDYHGNPIKARHRIHRRRLRSVIQDLIYLAARVIRHARQWILGFGVESPFYETFHYLYLKWAG